MAVPTTSNYQLLVPTPLDPSGANAWGPWVNSNTSYADSYYLSLAGNFINSTQPTIPATSLPTNGQFWINNTTNPWTLSVFDGTEWLEIGSIDTSTHVWTPAGISPTGAVSCNVQKFTSGTGTYTPSAGMAFCFVEVVGGGGAGGSSSSGGTAAGGGGGGGGYAKSLYTAAQIGVSQTYTVGIGGPSGGSSGSAGGTGSASSFGSFIICNGGSGGGGGASGLIGGGPGGSTNSGGNIFNITGWYGMPNSVQGAGGGNPIGTGGAPVYVANSPGNGGNLYGGGGSSATGSGTGGTGSAGVIIVTEFIQ